MTAMATAAQPEPEDTPWVRPDREAPVKGRATQAPEQCCQSSRAKLDNQAVGPG